MSDQGTKRARTFQDKPLEHVADVMAGCDQNSSNNQMAKAEFYLRQTEAIQGTAEYTKRYTRYMFWSVVVLGVGTFLSVLVNILIAFVVSSS